MSKHSVSPWWGLPIRFRERQPRAAKLVSLVAHHWLSAYRSITQWTVFDHVAAYCMFIGHGRSGHSLIGALLDAHPNVVIGHELDALKFLDLGFTRRQLFHLLLENSRAHARLGRRWSGYSYDVPGQWQGRFTTLKVIGDKKGGKSTRRLTARPQFLGQLRETVSCPIKLLHVVRNPFDTISTEYQKRSQRRGVSLRECIDDYFLLCQTVENVRNATHPGDLRDIRFERFVENPRDELERLCRFLDLDCAADYRDACASIIFPAPRTTRDAVAWRPIDISVVQAKMREFHFLDGYSFEG